MQDWPAKLGRRIARNTPGTKKPPLWGGFDSSLVASRRLDRADGNLAAAAVLLRIERDLLALHQPAHSGALQRGRVNEDVLAAVVRLNEAEAFLVVVELYGAGNHMDILSLIQGT
jgi:hypothetical protein